MSDKKKKNEEKSEPKDEIVNHSGKKVDEAWKEQAQREKEEWAKKEKERREQLKNIKLPQASFLNFLSGIATQTLMQLGELANPFTREKHVSLDEAKYSIDLIAVLEEKTKGNLSEEEQRYQTAILYDLRMRYVEAVERAKNGEGPEDEDAGEPEPGKGKIIT